MEYLADTVTIIRHFSKTGRIGRQARSILEGVEGGEHHMFLSTISLVEILYLSGASVISDQKNGGYAQIDHSSNFSKSPGMLEVMVTSLRARRTASLRPPMP